MSGQQREIYTNPRRPAACLRRNIHPRMMCLNQNERRCAFQPFLFPVDHPPWFHCPPRCPVYQKPLVRRAEYDHELTYDLQQDYKKPSNEGRILPTMAFYFYADHIRDPPGMPCTSKGCRYGRRDLPWPPLPHGECPPPTECEPCGPGPWANPDVRKFFYIDCQ